jgi:hypothetical protein
MAGGRGTLPGASLEIYTAAKPVGNVGAEFGGRV